MGRPEHVKADLAVISHPRADLEQWRSLFPQPRPKSAD
jgi:hypothetical protein